MGGRRPKVRDLKSAHRGLASKCVFVAQLDASAVPETDDDAVTAVWVQVALAGTYKGYEGGEFTFDQKVFETIAQNFRASPSYRAGAEGYGETDVVPWDFHHASEVGATSGTVPVMGAPAQGWVRDLEVRQGDNGPELWALTRWLEPARTYIAEGKYRWASVTVYYDTRDARTGEKRGPQLMSIALTNKPFIEGMQELVAAERGEDGERIVTASYYDKLGIYCEPAKDAADALNQLRKVFGLPATASAGDALMQIAKVQEWVMVGGAPLGVDLASIVGAMRTIFGLPALSLNEEVFEQAQNLVSSLVEQAPATETNQAPAVPAAVATEKTTMDLIKKLATILGVTQSEAAILEALEGLVGLKLALSKAFGLSPNAATGVVLEAAEGSKGTAAKLGALLKALGVEDSDGAITRLSDIMKQAKELEEVMPELSELRTYKAKAEDTAIEEEVDEAMASYDLHEGVRDGLVLMRKGDPKKFLEKFPKKEPAAPKVETSAAGAGNPLAAVLQQTIAAGAGGIERRVTQQPDGSLNLSAPGAAPADPNRQPLKVIDLTAMSGRNRTERLIAYVRSQAGDKGASLSYDDVFNKAIALKNDKTIKIVDAA